MHGVDVVSVVVSASCACKAKAQECCGVPKPFTASRTFHACAPHLQVARHALSPHFTKVWDNCYKVQQGTCNALIACRQSQLITTSEPVMIAFSATALCEDCVM